MQNLKKIHENALIKNDQSALKTLEWDILNPDRSINLEINNKRRTIALFNLETKKKSGSSLNPDIHHSKVPSSLKDKHRLKYGQLTIINTLHKMLPKLLGSG